MFFFQLKLVNMGGGGYAPLRWKKHKITILKFYKTIEIFHPGEWRKPHRLKCGHLNTDVLVMVDKWEVVLHLDLDSACHSTMFSQLRYRRGEGVRTILTSLSWKTHCLIVIRSLRSERDELNSQSLIPRVHNQGPRQLTLWGPWKGVSCNLIIPISNDV